jgi:hypothetical protein
VEKDLIKIISNNWNLKAFVINECPQVTDETILALGKYCSRL